jgi:glutamate synthase (NADPH/NADH) large chain
VGRYDLLEQTAAAERLDLAELITPLEEFLDLEPIDLPVATDELVEARAEAGLVRARPIRMEPKQASAELAGLADRMFSGEPVRQQFPRPTDAHDRVLGTELAGEVARARIYEGAPKGEPTDVLAELSFNGGSVAGQGFGAFNSWGLVVRVEGGAQDGVGKTMLGGTVSILKGRNREGQRVNGSVGKSFAYGAQRGRLFVQGSADSRFCIRLSGADVVLGGEPAEPLDDSRGCIVDRANAKGFAFEYMTAGRAVVLGDLGPWACSGMTGGRVYARVNPEWNLDREAISRRLGEGAKVELQELDAEAILDVEELLGHFAEELRATEQDDEAERVLRLGAEAARNFLMIVPHKVQADPNISTE